MGLQYTWANKMRFFSCTGFAHVYKALRQELSCKDSLKVFFFCCLTINRHLLIEFIGGLLTKLPDYSRTKAIFKSWKDSLGHMNSSHKKKYPDLFWGKNWGWHRWLIDWFSLTTRPIFSQFSQHSTFSVIQKLLSSGCWVLNSERAAQVIRKPINP